MSWEAPTGQIPRLAPRLLGEDRAGASVLGFIDPPASPEEVVAIVAAMEAMWPRPVAAALDEQHRTSSWRFSGRWWARPVAARRDRPWYT